MEARGARWAKGQKLPGGAGDSHRVRLETGEAAQILACPLQDRVYSHLSQATVGLYPQTLAFLPPNLSMSWIPCHWLLSTSGDCFTNLPLALCPSLFLPECLNWTSLQRFPLGCCAQHLDPTSSTFSIWESPKVTGQLP